MIHEILPRVRPATIIGNPSQECIHAPPGITGSGRF